MNTYGPQLAFWAVTALCGAFAAWVQQKFKAQKKELVEQKAYNTAVALGVQALLRDRIIQAYNHYQDKGFCPIYGMENVQALYLQYHNLGGNGTITELVEKLKSMPTEQAAKERG